MNIKDVCDTYIECKMLAGSSKETIRIYKALSSRYYGFFGDKNVSDFTLKDIYDFRRVLDRDNVSHNCQSEYICKLKTLLKFANDNITTCDVVKKIPHIKYVRKERRFLTPEQVSDLIDKTKNKRDKAIISMLYSSGIRISELISLNRSDIRDNMFNVVGKGGKDRLCFIDTRTSVLLKEYLSNRKDNYSALFITSSGNRVSSANIRKVLKRLSVYCDFSFLATPHMLRHSFATNFIQNNGNIRVLADMLGHSSVNTTMIYTHNTNPDLLRAYRKYHTC